LIISRVRGYHGTNYGGTSAQGIALNRVGYGELLADVVQVPSDDVEALSVLMAEHADRLAAVITEPVQGAAGVFPPVEGYLAETRRLCDQHGALLIFDEVITGFGRMGRWFGAEHYGVTPDITTFAKGVTSGLPAARWRDRGSSRARRARGGSRIRPPSRLHLFGPSRRLRRSTRQHRHHRRRGPPRCRREDGCSARDRAAVAGSRRRLRSSAWEVAIFGAAMRPDQNAMAVRDRMLELGVVTRAIGTETVTFCPPFVTTDAQVDRIVDALATALR
jgi:putrescine---pyruvate transaminase